MKIMKDKRIEIVGFNIKIERQRKKLTQEQLAEKINISSNSLINIEGGKQTPSCLVLYDISKAINVPLEDLYKDI